MKTIPKILFYGFLSWLLPFLFSFLFYNREGQLQVSYDLFKSVMIVFAAASGCYFLFYFFKGLSKDFLKNGILVGLFWLGINLVLDALILLPIMKVSFTNYMETIGLRYFIIPIMSFTFGLLLEQKLKSHEN